MIKLEIAALDGLVSYMQAIPEVSNKAASMAINQVAQRGGMRLIRDDILDQIAFPKDYLSGDRLRIAQFATPDNPTAVIRARKRATSLARFARGNVIGRAGVTVEVGRGHTTRLAQAWLVRLKKGASLTEDNYNIGLAVRVKTGEEIKNKKYTHKSWLVPGHVALLYGPSVDQVFRDVADQVGKPIAEMVATEFTRQMERLL